MAVNPYLSDQANAITQQATNNLQQNILPGINSGAVAAGGYGGSRQGIAQGLAIGQTNQGLAAALANLRGNAYQSDQQNQLQRYLANMQNQTQRDLGFGNLYAQNRQLDQSQAMLGANLYNMANSGYLGQGQGIYNVGQTQQNAPWQATQGALGAMSPFSGLGGTTTTQQGQNQLANGLGGAIGGWQLGSNLWNLGFGQP